MTYGKLYGVGVGPGAPDLLTLRALEVLRRVPVLALPRSSDHGASMAWRIVKPALGEVAGQERLFLTFPMSKDPARLLPAWDKAFATIGERLERGQDVAFATEGDPSLFSTFIYLAREAPRRWPGIAVEVVPGVSSITAVPAVTGIPLADGQERIAIIPGTYGVADLAGLLRQFDTVVLMKIGPEMPQIIAALDEQGLLPSAVYVAKATMGEQRIIRDLRDLPPGREDCFAMVVVSRKERSGVLAGAVPFRDEVPGAMPGNISGAVPRVVADAPTDAVAGAWVGTGAAAGAGAGVGTDAAAEELDAVIGAVFDAASGVMIDAVPGTVIDGATERVAGAAG